MRNKIIAVDFDGTLCESKYPAFGAPRKDVINRLLKEQQAGARVILWTCRSGEDLAAAIYWCLEQGLVFDAINENLKETVEYFGSNSRKICADEYWDDKAVLPFERENDGFYCVNTWRKFKNVSRETITKGIKTMDFLTVLNAQAERVHADLIEAKRKLETTSGSEAAYHSGRAEELLKWYESLEALIDNVVSRRAEERKKTLLDVLNEREATK